MGIEPTTAGHVALVTNLHHPCLADLPRELGNRVFAVARVVTSGRRRPGHESLGFNRFVAGR